MGIIADMVFMKIISTLKFSPSLFWIYFDVVHLNVSEY